MSHRPAPPGCELLASPSFGLPPVGVRSAEGHFLLSGFVFEGEILKKIFLFSPFSWEKALPFFKNGDIIFRQIVERAPEPCVWGPLYVGAAGAPRGGGRPLP